MTGRSYRPLVLLGALVAVLSASVPAALAGGGAAKCMQVYLHYNSTGPTLSNADAAAFARYDMFNVNRNRY